MPKARVSVDVRKVLRDLKFFEKRVNYAIKEVLVEYVTDFVGAVAQVTPLGTPEGRDPMSQYYRLYALRQAREGYRIEGGLARGNWRVVFRDGVTSVVQQYDKNPSDTAARAFERMDSEYVLGKPIYIINRVSYIDRLREGYSPQAEAGEIDAVISNYKSMSRYRSVFQNALAGG